MNHDDNIKLQDEFLSEINKIYPTFKTSTSNTTSINNIVTSAQHEFSLTQKSLDPLEYALGKQTKFIHYTSLDALYGILNSGELRLYDLNNMFDPFEFNTLIKKRDLPIDQNQIDYFKKSLFISSLCAYDEDFKDNFNMWRLYGRNGQGVAIVFEVLNPMDNWRNFLIAKVQYGSDNEESKKLENAIKFINDFVKNREFVLDRIPQLIGILLMLHKNEIWREENEYRICTYLDYNLDNLSFDNPFYPLKNKLSLILKQSGKKTAFVPYPTNSILRKQIKETFSKNSDDSFILKNMPQLKISKIIAGYTLSDEFVKHLIDYVYYMSSHLNAGFINVEKSHLSEYF